MKIDEYDMDYFKDKIGIRIVFVKEEKDINRSFSSEKIKNKILEFVNENTENTENEVKKVKNKKTKIKRERQEDPISSLEV